MREEQRTVHVGQQRMHVEQRKPHVEQRTLRDKNGDLHRTTTYKYDNGAREDAVVYSRSLNLREDYRAGSAFTLNVCV
jgi:hypothetical protein